MVTSLAENPKARELVPVFKAEAGLVLTGSEVLAGRNHSLSVRGAFLRFVGGEAYLVGLKTGRYLNSSDWNFDPDRPKKVLLKKTELNRLSGFLSQKGVVCVPARIYLQGRFIKVALVAGRPRRKWEKREKEKKKAQEKEAAEYL